MKRAGTKKIVAPRDLSGVVDGSSLGVGMEAVNRAQIRHAIENVGLQSGKRSQQQSEKKTGSNAHRLHTFCGTGYSITAASAPKLPSPPLRTIQAPSSPAA